MKRIKAKFKRKMKYWRVSYKQASRTDRLLMAMCTLAMLVYAWWVLIIL